MRIKYDIDMSMGTLDILLSVSNWYYNIPGCYHRFPEHQFSVRTCQGLCSLVSPFSMSNNWGKSAACKEFCSKNSRLDKTLSLLSKKS